MNALQLLVYVFLRVTVRLFFHLYYPRTLVLGKANLRLKGPTLVVTNHPNTLIDALNAASRVSRPVFYLVNAGMFQHPVMARLLSFLYCIPVERPQDVNGRPINNEKAFDVSTDFLRRGHSIFIAPEGGSEMERRLRPLRTGTARIALLAEEKHGFSLGIQILPIGLTYSKPDQSGSALTVHAGTPIPVKDWQEAYEKNPRQAISSLTKTMEERLTGLILHTQDAAEDRLHAELEDILDVARPAARSVRWQRVHKLLHGMRSLGQSNPSAYHSLQDTTLAYATAKERLKLSESAFGQLHIKDILVLLTFPVWLFAWAHHILPVTFLRSLPKKLNLYEGYRTTLKWLGALALLPIWYGLLISLVPWGCPTILRGPYAVALLLSGYVYAALRPGWKRLAAMLRRSAYALFRPSAWKALKAQRKKILTQLEHDVNMVTI